MKVTFYTKPYEHFIIDDLLPPKAAAQILDEAISLEKHYTEAKIYGRANKEFDDCAHCLQQKNVATSAIRSNQTVYLNTSFPNDQRMNCVTTSILDGKLFGPGNLNETITSKGGIWKLWPAVNTNDVQISRYGKCDFFDWHTDPLPTTEQMRVFTAVYYVNKEPVTFKGGQINLGSVDDYKTVEPVHNRCVIFPSDSYHMVDNVHICSDDWGAGRFSVNYWAGFDNDCKIRKVLNTI